MGSLAGCAPRSLPQRRIFPLPLQKGRRDRAERADGTGVSAHAGAAGANNRRPSSVVNGARGSITSMFCNGAPLAFVPPHQPAARGRTDPQRPGRVRSGAQPAAVAYSSQLRPNCLPTQAHLSAETSAAVGPRPVSPSRAPSEHDAELRPRQVGTLRRCQQAAGGQAAGACCHGRWRPSRFQGMRARRSVRRPLTRALMGSCVRYRAPAASPPRCRSSAPQKRDAVVSNVASMDAPIKEQWRANLHTGERRCRRMASPVAEAAPASISRADPRSTRAFYP